MEIFNCPCGCHRLVDENHKPIDPNYCTSCQQFGEENTTRVQHSIWKAQLCPSCYAKFFPNGEVDVQAFFDYLSR